MKLALLFAFFWSGLLTFASAASDNYNFVPYTSQDNCLTMAASNQANDAPFFIAPCTKTDNYQKFTYNTVATSYLNFQSSHAPGCCHMCLDVVDGTGNEVRVKQIDCNPGTKTQYWLETAAPSGANAGYFWYKNYGTGRCLTGEGMISYVDQYDCSSGALHQLWNITTDTFVNGQSLKNQRWGTCLKVNDGNPLAGAETGVDVCSATLFSQHFKVVKNTPKTWQLVGSTKCLDGGSTGGSPAYQYDCYSTALNQNWLTVNFPNEATYKFTYYVDVLSGMCLTWDPDNLANVHMEACVQGNTNQQWVANWV